MSTETKQDYKNELLNKAIIDLVEDAIKPMSILEIKAKYDH